MLLFCYLLFVNSVVCWNIMGEKTMAATQIYSTTLPETHGKLSYTVESSDTSKLSVLLMDSANFEAMRVGSAYKYYDTFSRTNVLRAMFTAAHYSVDLKTGTSLMIVIKNENLLEDITFSYDITVEPDLLPTPSDSDGLSSWRYVLIGVGIVIILSASIGAGYRYKMYTVQQTGPGYMQVSTSTSSSLSTVAPQMVSTMVQPHMASTVGPHSRMMPGVPPLVVQNGGFVMTRSPPNQPPIPITVTVQ
eukprot:TRINITY_DN25183_c0_g1_i1.p1 TRINITY_DN25183_c0_g1~~TRINITY_DN25183_c0_g1_i1.p1  ORF type:complete len:247 (+),score=23.69 TRINITY_DN25183_c0_g1_i1:64-804(+)